MGREEFDAMVFGDTRKRERHEESTSNDIGEIGKTTVKGVVTVAEIGVAGAVLGGILGF